MIEFRTLKELQILEKFWLEKVGLKRAADLSVMNNSAT
jgi:hypothetical protein